VKIVWDYRALRELAEIDAYIAQDNPTAGTAMVQKIRQRVSVLSEFPESARSGRVKGTRELIVSPYVVVYRIRDGMIEIASVMHGQRRWPRRF
jgi:addiction module RelE/StbE family toxin